MRAGFVILRTIHRFSSISAANSTPNANPSSTRVATDRQKTFW